MFTDVSGGDGDCGGYIIVGTAGDDDDDDDDELYTILLLTSLLELLYEIVFSLTMFVSAALLFETVESATSSNSCNEVSGCGYATHGTDGNKSYHACTVCIMC